MKISILLIIPLVLVNYVVCKAQNLPKVIPPSPTSMQFQKYGDYPVGNFTGVPEISILLYTIKEGDLELPLTLSYHASGVKPTDPNGFVGLGWSLNAGGRLSRTIMDETDEAGAVPNPFYTAAQLSTYTYWQLPSIMNPLESYKDTEPDIFSYSFGDNQGKFVLKRDASRTPLLIPYKPLKIIGHLATTGAQRFDYFNITDESGFQYKFYQGDYPSTPGATGPTGWNVESMTSPVDSSNHLNFTYALGPIERMSKRVDKFIADDDVIDNLMCRSCWSSGQTSECRPMVDYLQYGAGSSDRDDYNINYTTYVNKEISFRSGKVRFVQNATTKMLDSIVIYNSINVVQKSFAFEYVQRPTSRVLLKSIKLYDANKQFINQYSFAYNNEQSYIPATENASTDFWGYYNGDISGNQSLLPNWAVYFEGRGTRTIGTNSRQAVESFMKTFVLERIIYPTGGSTFFNYEANKYRGVGINGYDGSIVGGLRIKNIINYTDQNLVVETKTYTYSSTWGNDVGIMDVYPNKEHFSYSQRFYFPSSDLSSAPWESFRRVFYSSEPYTEICPHGSPVVYTTVTEYIGDGQKNTGKNVYEYDYNEAEYSTFQTNDLLDQHGVAILYRHFLNPCEEWRSGQRKSKTCYKNVNGVYTAVYSETNEYQEFNRESLQALHMDRFVNYANDPCGSYPGVTDEAVFTYGEVSPVSVFNYGDYYLQSGEKKLVSTIINANGITTTTSYEYANQEHNQPTKKTTTNSKGESMITTLKYPHDFVSTSPYNTMVNVKHMWNPVIEQTEYKNSISNPPLSATRTNYADWGNTVIAPLTVDVKKGGSAFDTRIRFISYDSRGNILSLSKEKDVIISYLWGYNRTLPVAEVTGASYAAISGLASQSILDNPLSTDQQIRKSLDSVRTGLAGTKALVKTYTYKPLVGMISQTDPVGKIIYYEYDGLGRLQHVRDENQNIIKKFSYAYLGRNEQGATEAAPQWQATGATRPKLCPQNSNYTTGVIQKQEKDVNASSITYNQIRWVDQGTDGAGSATDWQYTATPIRCKRVSGYYTGEQEREQVNLNPCSFYYNQSRWTVVGTNTTACPLPTSWTSEDRSGTYYSTTCPAGQMPNPIIVSAPAGMFTSTISLEDANQKAVNYAQNYANQHGTCYTPPATLIFTNNANAQTFDVYLTNVSTGQSFNYHITQQSQTLGDVPAGTYNIQVVPGFDVSYSFSVGCDHTSTGPTANFSNIPLSYDCNTIVVDTF